ncbi:histidine phosphatase family protein [Paenibacillus chitinolyticus]|uniref:histidine phosphatase family protein n=1 Tax=Paenibacillus chitinolyticus TaxID=79263 RepID=UPI002DD04682|nr:histidine phosphatase family protein [Paenibacillus chitinolyticus]
MRIKRFIWMTLLLLMVSAQIGAAEGTERTNPVNSSLLDSLRQGGYILFVRHGEATIGEDRPNLIFRDCSTQRNLSAAGRAQALLFGKTLRSLQIPVQYPVAASPFCRTRESAELAFGKEQVELDPFWVRIYKLSGPVSATEKENTLATLTSVLEKVPPPGTNRVILAHSFPKGIGLGEIPYMGTVVVKPKGKGNGYEIAGRFSLNELENSLREK